MALSEKVVLQDRMKWAKVGGTEKHMRFSSLKGDMLWLLGSDEGQLWADEEVVSKEGVVWGVHRSVVGERMSQLEGLENGVLEKYLCWVYTGSFGVKKLNEGEAEKLKVLVGEEVRRPVLAGVIDFEKSDFHDVSIAAKGGGVFWGSKAALAARSPFFQELFTPGKWEETENIDLEISEPVLEGVWKYLRGGSMEGTSQETLCELLEVSKFFDLEGLAVECGRTLLRHMSPDTLPAMWAVLADAQSADAEDAARSYFIENFAAVADSQNFTTLRKQLLLSALRDGAVDVPTPFAIDAIKRWCEANEEPTEEFLPPNTFINKDTKSWILCW